MSLLQTLDLFFASSAPIQPGDGIVVAFSGGPDSTALLSVLTDWSRDRRLDLAAAHLDHALDPGSEGRARAAERIAARLGTPFHAERRPVAAVRRRGESLEAAARRVRYRFLEEARLRLGARYVATGHHLDDQAETVAMRLLLGTGTTGLASIRPRLGAVIRPLLGRSRVELASWLSRHAIEPLDDPSNRDPRRPRNRIRHHVLPTLVREAPRAAGDLAALARRARGAGQAIERRIEEALEPRETERGPQVDLRRLADLPEILRGPAVALLHRRAGATHPPTRASLAELTRQIASGERIGCDTGGGWRLVSRGPSLSLEREPAPARPFAYTLGLPGEVLLPETAGAFRLRRQQVEPWMFAPCSWRAGLSLPLTSGDRITVRSRRPGDRVRPFGCSYDRRLKDVLIDRKIPRNERDRLPLLCIDQRVLWIPGVTIDESCRLNAGGEAWVAELEER